MNPIAPALARTTLGLDVTVRNLTMFPLLHNISDVEGTGSTRAEPLVLDDALSSGWAHVTEISDAGSVPELRFVNKSAQPVFILDGEELVGAKQNRVVNLSILVPPQSTLTIPVSCVEAGRWHARSRSFTAAPRAQYAAGRAMRMRQVTASMMHVGVARSDQSAVWEDISEKAARLNAPSETSAMSAMFVDHADAIETFVEGLAPVPAQVGALLVIGDRIAGLELFQTATLLRKLLPKVVRSYALDAIDPEGFAPHAGRRRRRRAPSAGSPLRVSADLFISQVAASPAKALRALGLGEDLRMEAPGVSAAALIHDDDVVHLSAFAA